MGNSLNQELEGKYVVLKRKYYKGDDPIERVFLCEGGFGCSSYTIGTAISGTFVIDRDKMRVEGYEVERLATPKEVDIAKTKFFEKNPQLELFNS
jgi:hypothetical protein